MASGFRTGLIVVVAFAAGVALYPGISLFAPKGDLKEEHGSGQAARQLWTCGMHPQVIQDKPGDCPICHMKLTPLAAETPGGEAGKTKDRRILYYWDPMMSPPYLSEKPGKSPMGMDLVPVYEDEVSAGEGVTIDPVVVQNMGVRIAAVTEGPLKTTIRAVGYFHEAQPLQRDVSLKIGGRAEKVHADTEGMHLAAGDPLLDVYSPDLIVAQEELIGARRTLDRLPPDAPEAARREAETTYESARRKLILWDVAPADVDAMAREERARDVVTFRTPGHGHLIERRITAGTSFEAGMKLFRIVDHSILWLEAHLYETDLVRVAPGMIARATVRGIPGSAHEGAVVLVHPHVDDVTRTGVVRVEYPNPDLRLKPGMFATVEIPVEIAPRAVLVPREAVIDTGTRQIAYVPAGGGTFLPRRVRMGVEMEDGRAQILEGLAPGESVVVSGQFLLDVESRTREAVRKFLAEGLMTKPGSAAGAETQGRQGTAPKGHEEHEDHPAAPKPSEPPGPGEPAPGPTELTPKVDAVVRAYLATTRAMLVEDGGASAKAAEGLRDAARALAEAAAGGAREEAARRAAGAADALAGKAGEAFVAAHKAVSAALVPLVQAEPPSRAAAGRLFVMHCPMVAAEWLQAEEEVANPYDPDMRGCGDVRRQVRTVEDGGRR